MQNDSEDSYTPLRHTDRIGKPTIEHDVRQLSQCSDLIPSQRCYGSIHMVGGSLHQGDQYHFVNEDVAQKEVNQLLESLRFPEMNQRANQIADAHQETFRWALESINGGDKASNSRSHVSVFDYEASYYSPGPRQSVQDSDDYGAWILGDESMFWVAGKPGSGKSTLMKFLSSSKQSRSLLRRRFHKQEVLILRHFFWLHGSEMQRSMKGCLCTLIRQVLQNNNKLVLETFRRKSCLREKRNTRDWSEHELHELLYDLFSASERAFGVFLDGLDEYDTRNDVRALLEPVQRLSGMCNSKICCSGRQENVFERVFLQRPKVRLQDLTYTDMRKMARAKLMVETQDAEAPITSLQLDSLSRRLASRAEGVFLWATVAIRALTMGIRACDDYQILLERLEDMPAEMEDLCSHILTRVNASGRRNLDSCLMYMALARLCPMSLLTFTLAADEQILRQVIQNKRSVTTSGIQQLLQACRMMESKMKAYTAGILEVVESGVEDEAQSHDQDITDVQGYVCQPGLCVCAARLFRVNRCFVSLPNVEGFYHMHKTTIRYMHRDIAENFDLAKIMNLSADREIELRLQAQKTFIAASLVKHKLGCLCNRTETVLFLYSFLREMGKSHASATMKLILEVCEMRPVFSENGSCCYGWEHEVFAAMSVMELRYGSGSDLSDPSVLDFPGLMAWLGYSSFFDAISYDASTWSSYYKGYLCACATKEDWSPSPKRLPPYLGQIRVISWLVGNGADILSPQVARPRLGESSGIVVRPPIVDCWCFILRLLEEPLLGREEKLCICDTLVPLLLAQKDSPEDSVAWSVDGNMQTKGKEEILSHHLLGHDLVFILRTTIRKLQVCTLESIAYLREGHQHNLATPSLKIEDIRYLYWKRPNEEREFFPGRTYVLDVIKLRQTRFEPTGSTVLEVLVHRKTMRLRSLKSLIHELEQCLPHCTTREGNSDSETTRLAVNETAIVQSLNVAPYHSFYMFYDHHVPLVPLDAKKELHHGQWHEYGALREWHEKRRRRIWSPSHSSTHDFHKYEEENQAIRPSYLPPLARKSTQGL